MEGWENERGRGKERVNKERKPRSADLLIA